METKTHRRLKIYSKHVVRSERLMSRHYIEVPWLNVSGIWLEQAGFKAGDAISITVEQGQLTIHNVASGK